VKELPNAPVPQPNVAQTIPPTEAPAPEDSPEARNAGNAAAAQGLLLPKESSPGQSIQDSLRAAVRKLRSETDRGRRPDSWGASGGRWWRPWTAYGGIEMLTPDEGVDFSNYLNRVYVTVKRNWFAVMPGSVELGEKGIVVLTFKISATAACHPPSRSFSAIREGAVGPRGVLFRTRIESFRAVASAVQGAVHRTAVHLPLQYSIEYLTSKVKISRQQVLGSLFLALVVLAVLVFRAGTFSSDEQCKNAFASCCCLGPDGFRQVSAGVWLAERLGGEVVACDSTQLYSDSILGQPSPAHRAPGHSALFDGCAGATGGSDCRRLSPIALAVLRDLRERGKLPIFTVARVCICVLGWRSRRSTAALRGIARGGCGATAKDHRPAICTGAERLDPEADSKIAPADEKTKACRRSKFACWTEDDICLHREAASRQGCAPEKSD